MNITTLRNTKHVSLINLNSHISRLVHTSIKLSDIRPLSTAQYLRILLNMTLTSSRTLPTLTQTQVLVSSTQPLSLRTQPRSYATTPTHLKSRVKLTFTLQFHGVLIQLGVNPHTDVNPNNETYPGPTAPLATRTRSRSRTLVEEGSTYLASSASVKSNFITTDQIRRNPSSSSHFDGNVEDRYPMALSSSFFSLYSKNSGSHHRIGSGRSQDQDSEEEEVEKEEEEDAGSIIAVTDTDGSNSEYGQDITQVHQEGEQQRGYPTTSSYSTISSEALEPTLIAYYSFSPDEVVASTADTSTSPTSPTTTATCNVVRAIIKDDRNNYLPLSSKILTQKATSNTKLNFSTSTSNADLSSSAVTWTNYDRAKSRGTIKRPAGIETDSSSLSQVYCCGRKGKENDGPQEYRPTARQRQRQIPPVYVKHGESEQEAHIQEGAVLEPASYSVFGSKNTDIINTNLNIRKVQDRKRERERSREKDITWDRDKDRDRVGVGRGSGVDVISQLRKKGGVGKENVPVPF
ncbi:hypothetical protein L218DRAFT_584700 [Marasmius fiardii PR-910]|nr:hypothetical protein L218DRAFT_584700 [Marasmius fiardii PR-910]